jgi:cell division protein FtsQ
MARRRFKTARGGKSVRAFRRGARRRGPAVLARVLAATAACGAAVLVLALVAGSSLFRLEDMTAVEVRGNRRVPRAEIVERSGIRPGTNIFSLDTAATAAAITAHPWVSSARVARRPPARIVITVREYDPVALAARPGGLVYVDGNGVLFAPARPGDELDYPVITGADPDPAALRRAVGFITAVRENDAVLPRQMISEVHVDGDGELTVFLADNPFPVRVGAGGDRVRRLAAVLERLSREDKLAVTRFVDLDCGGNILVRFALPVV